jgi:hypothetical protein
MPQGAQFSSRCPYLEVAMIGCEPLVDDDPDLERALAKPESTRRLFSTISGVALDHHGERTVIHDRSRASDEIPGVRLYVNESAKRCRSRLPDRRTARCDTRRACL